MIKNVKALTTSAYISMFFLGMSSALIGAAARNIGLTPFQIGLLLAVQNIGFMIAVWIAGALADTYEKPRIMLVGSVILALSLLTFYQSGLFWVNLVIMFFNGAGIGVYEGVTDAMLIDMHTRRVSFHVNVNHFFVTFGSIIIAGYLTYLQDNWRAALIQSGVVVILLVVFFALARLKNKHQTSDRYLDRLKILSRERPVMILFIAALLIVGVETGAIGILTTYLMELRGFTQVTSKIGLTLLLVGIALGRLFVGFFTRREHIIPYLLGLLGLSLIFSAMLYFVNLGNLTYPVIFLTGLAMSALLPLVITLAGLLYQDISGTVLGIIKIALPLGGILIPFAMSLLVNSSSLQASLVIFPVVYLLGLVLLFFGLRYIKLEAASAQEHE